MARLHFALSPDHDVPSAAPIVLPTTSASARVGSASAFTYRADIAMSACLNTSRI
jgi:hypothetical protein